MSLIKMLIRSILVLVVVLAIVNGSRTEEQNSSVEKQLRVGNSSRNKRFIFFIVNKCKDQRGLINSLNKQLKKIRGEIVQIPQNFQLHLTSEMNRLNSQQQECDMTLMNSKNDNANSDSLQQDQRRLRNENDELEEDNEDLKRKIRAKRRKLYRANKRVARMQNEISELQKEVNRKSAYLREQAEKEKDQQKQLELRKMSTNKQLSLLRDEITKIEADIKRDSAELNKLRTSSATLTLQITTLRGSRDDASRELKNIEQKLEECKKTPYWRRWLLIRIHVMNKKVKNIKHKCATQIVEQEPKSTGCDSVVGKLNKCHTTEQMEYYNAKKLITKSKNHKKMVKDLNIQLKDLELRLHQIENGDGKLPLESDAIKKEIAKFEKQETTCKVTLSTSNRNLGKLQVGTGGGGTTGTCQCVDQDWHLLGENCYIMDKAERRGSFEQAENWCKANLYDASIVTVGQGNRDYVRYFLDKHAQHTCPSCTLKDGKPVKIGSQFLYLCSAPCYPDAQDW